MAAFGLTLPVSPVPKARANAYKSGINIRIKWSYFIFYRKFDRSIFFYGVRIVQIFKNTVTQNTESTNSETAMMTILLC